jgi:hypothetical protein
VAFFVKSDCGCGCSEVTGPCDDCAPPCVAPTISGGGVTHNGTVGVAFSESFSATGDPTITYGATGLPPGLSIDSATGVISGTPTTAGTYSVSISASNGCGTDTDSLTIEIDEATPVPCSGEPTLVCDSIAASQTKCGWEEQTGYISTPPKRYKTRTWFGWLDQFDYIPDETCTVPGDIVGTYRVEVTGACTFSTPGCSPPTSGNQYRETINGVAGSWVDACDISIGVLAAFCSSGPCPEAVINAEQTGFSGDGVCYVGSPSFKVLNGLGELLSVEYTTAEMIADAVAALPSYPGTWDGDCAAIRDLASDELSYSLQRFKYKFQLPDMTGNTTAQITWTERFTPDGGGSPTDTPKVYDWDGVATETGEYTVNEPASNGTISIVDVAMTCT